MDDPDKFQTRRIPAATLAAVQRRVAVPSPPKPQIVHGVVREGVERGAIVLLDEDGALIAQLLGGDPAVLADGARVRVTGVFRRDLFTTVQQGPPFQVIAAIRL